MQGVRTILLEIATNIVYIVSDPIFIVLAILIIYMYKREVKDSKDNIYKNEVERTAVKDIFRGVIIGAVVSLILTYFGVRVPITKGMLILIPITVMLVFIEPKWGCFSYVIPVAYAIWTVGKLFGKELTWVDLDYEHLIILIGVLHIIEGCLVGLHGHENSKKAPLYQGNGLVSGYVLRKYWPVPLLVFEYQGSGLILIPIYAMLAYADIAVNKKPKAKARAMGSILVTYGVITTSLGYFAAQEILPVFFVVLLMPMLHESMFLVNQKDIGNIRERFVIK